MVLWYNYFCNNCAPFILKSDLGMTPTIKQSTLALFNFIQSNRGIASNPLLEVLVHKLLVGVLTTQKPSTEPMGGPFDYSLLLAMTTSEGKFMPPTDLCGYCSRAQYCFRVIIIHCSCLGGLNAAYQPVMRNIESHAEEQPVRALNDPVASDSASSEKDGHSLYQFLLSNEQPPGQNNSESSDPALFDFDDNDDHAGDGHGNSYESDAIDDDDLWANSPPAWGPQEFTNPMQTSQEEKDESSVTLSNTLAEDGLIVCTRVFFCLFQDIYCIPAL